MSSRESWEKALSYAMSSPATFLVVLLGGVLLASGVVHWGYGEANGPETWVESFPDCAGNRQSPLDLAETSVSTGPHFSWQGYDDLPATMALTNNGHTVELSSSGQHPRLVQSDGRIFQLDAVHFHWGKEDHEGSEHSIHGKMYALEMHAVHRHVNASGNIVSPAEVIVLSTLFEHTSAAPWGDDGLNKFIHHAEFVEEAETSTPVEPFAWSDLLHHFEQDFYWYEGSLTTPPCSEVVTFFVPRRERRVSTEQMTLFRSFLGEENVPISGNFRPLQRQNGRTIYLKL